MPVWNVIGRRAATAVLLSGCAASSSTLDLEPGHVGVRVVTQDRYYDVRGTTPEEMQATMLANAPMSDGRRVRGRTSWNVRWRYQIRRQGGGCSVEDPRVSLEMIVDLPRWLDSASASDSLVTAWREFYDALHAHEKRHAQISLEGANAVREALSRVQGSCSTLQDVANREGRAVIDRYRRLNREFDEETRHGIAQGAVWPPAWAARPGGPAPPAGPDTSWIALTPGGRVEWQGLHIFEVGGPDGRHVYVRDMEARDSLLVYEHAGTIHVRLSHDGRSILINHDVGQYDRLVVLVEVETGVAHRLDQEVRERFARRPLDPRLRVAPRAVRFSDDDARVLIGMLLVHVDAASTDEAVRLSRAFERRWYVVDVETARVVGEYSGRHQPTKW